MAASNAAVVTSMDSAFSTIGITPDGSTDGYVDNMSFDQLQEMIRIVKASGGTITVTAGIMFIKPVPGDTSVS